MSDVTDQEHERAVDAWGRSQVAELLVLLPRCTPAAARELLEWGVDSGAGSLDVERLPVALWRVSYGHAVRLVLLDAAGRQWADGELVALLERMGATSPQAQLELHRGEIATARQLGRGKVRDVLWSMLDATKPIVDRETGLVVDHVPDNATRFRAGRELLRQHGGWTSKGFAAEVQDELDRLERQGAPAASSSLTH